MLQIMSAVTTRVTGLIKILKRDYPDRSYSGYYNFFTEVPKLTKYFKFKNWRYVAIVEEDLATPRQSVSDYGKYK